MSGTNTAINCIELLKDYETRRTASNPRKLTFLGVDGYDVYNISCEFEADGKRYIAGRVEKRDNELSFVRLFEKREDYVYEAVMPELTFNMLQDPFVEKIHGYIILGGVQIITDPLDSSRIINWCTCFYRGKTLSELKLFAMGPNHMKDIRLTALADGRVGIFTRPQGMHGKLGKIGYISVDTLDDVNEDIMLQAKIFDTHFIPSEWGGANQIHLLKDGRLGVIGHISYRDSENGLHYHSMAFVFDPKTQEHTPVRIIATRSDMQSGPAKRPDLKDVIFTGGIVRGTNGQRTVLYTGVSDCEAHCVEIDDPFEGFEGTK